MGHPSQLPAAHHRHHRSARHEHYGDTAALARI
jgi:hypothetical protein